MTSLHNNIKRPRRRNRHKVMTMLERYIKEQKRKGNLPPSTKVTWDNRENQG